MVYDSLPGNAKIKMVYAAKLDHILVPIIQSMTMHSSSYFLLICSQAPCFAA